MACSLPNWPCRSPPRSPCPAEQERPESALLARSVSPAPPAAPAAYGGGSGLMKLGTVSTSMWPCRAFFRHSALRFGHDRFWWRSRLLDRLGAIGPECFVEIGRHRNESPCHRTIARYQPARICGGVERERSSGRGRADRHPSCRRNMHRMVSSLSDDRSSRRAGQQGAWKFNENSALASPRRPAGSSPFPDCFGC